VTSSFRVFSLSTVHENNKTQPEHGQTQIFVRKQWSMPKLMSCRWLVKAIAALALPKGNSPFSRIDEVLLLIDMKPQEI
jgi:hypothetical protein